MKKLQKADIEKMNYVQLLASIEEVNRPPGGKDSIRRVVQNTFLSSDSKVLDVGCNTGYSTLEIAHLVKCHVTGVDISPEMIATAQIFRGKDAHSDLVSFQVADGMKLPFKDRSFDLTMSGGSTAFIEDKVAALKEYARVTKEWGFVADINFYYKGLAPSLIIEKLNKLMQIDVQPWDKEYWMNLYRETGLEIYHTYFNDVYVPTENEIQLFCLKMSNKVNATDDARLIIYQRLVEIMSLFSENHKYLEYGVFILRKREDGEQISLFGA